MSLEILLLVKAQVVFWECVSGVGSNLRLGLIAYPSLASLNCLELKSRFLQVTKILVKPVLNFRTRSSRLFRAVFPDRSPSGTRSYPWRRRPKRGPSGSPKSVGSFFGTIWDNLLATSPLDQYVDPSLVPNITLIALVSGEVPSKSGSSRRKGTMC